MKSGLLNVTAADLFRFLYKIRGVDVDLSKIRVHHHVGADALCRAWGAEAMTRGSDIYFRTGRFAPHTRDGLWLLAHEIAHVVQQHRGPVSARLVGGGVAVGLRDGPEELEANAAADAVVAGRPFAFAPAPFSTSARSSVHPAVQRYMAWEHLALGDLEPATVRDAARAASRGFATVDVNMSLQRLEAQCALLEDLGRDPEDVDSDRLQATYPGLQMLRLPGSGLVLTLGELNILPDYLSHPADIESAPAAFLVPLIQSIRMWSIRELQRVIGGPISKVRLPGVLRYASLRRVAELYETVQLDALGKRCGFPAWELYSSVLGRNSGHFAPFSWYRWQSFHLMAREMIDRSRSAADDERELLRVRARLYAAYADHFLQDSFAAGHLINKTLIMQWYVEWLAASHIPVADRELLATMTYERQPHLHGPDLYEPELVEARGRLYPKGKIDKIAGTDPQTAVEAATLEESIQASGVLGRTAEEQRAAYTCYLAFLGSSVVQLAARVVHGYFNKHSLVVASHANGPRYRIWGDHTMFAGDGGAGRAAAASDVSRRAISDLIRRGGTEITSQEIFERFPSHVESDDTLLTLRQWHDTRLREQCFEEIFGLRSSRAMRIFLTLASRRLGTPSAHYIVLRAGREVNNARRVPRGGGHPLS